MKELIIETIIAVLSLIGLAMFYLRARYLDEHRDDIDSGGTW